MSKIVLVDGVVACAFQRASGDVDVHVTVIARSGLRPLAHNGQRSSEIVVAVAAGLVFARAVALIRRLHNRVSADREVAGIDLDSGPALDGAARDAHIAISREVHGAILNALDRAARDIDGDAAAIQSAVASSVARNGEPAIDGSVRIRVLDGTAGHIEGRTVAVRIHGCCIATAVRDSTALKRKRRGYRIARIRLGSVGVLRIPNHLEAVFDELDLATLGRVPNRKFRAISHFGADCFIGDDRLPIQIEHDALVRTRHLQGVSAPRKLHVVRQGHRITRLSCRDGVFEACVVTGSHVSCEIVDGSNRSIGAHVKRPCKIFRRIPIADADRSDRTAGNLGGNCGAAMILTSTARFPEASLGIHAVDGAGLDNGARMRADDIVAGSHRIAVLRSGDTRIGSPNGQVAAVVDGRVAIAEARSLHDDVFERQVTVVLDHEVQARVRVGRHGAVLDDHGAALDKLHAVRLGARGANSLHSVVRMAVQIEDDVLVAVDFNFAGGIAVQRDGCRRGPRIRNGGDGGGERVVRGAVDGGHGSCILRFSSCKCNRSLRRLDNVDDLGRFNRRFCGRVGHLLFNRYDRLGFRHLRTNRGRTFLARISPCGNGRIHGNDHGCAKRHC